MKLVNLAVVRLTIILLLGILTGFQLSPPLELLFLLNALSLLFFLFALLRAHRLLLQNTLFGLACLFLFFFLGMTTVQLHNPQHQPKHYSNLQTSHQALLLLSLSKRLKTGTYHDRFVGEVQEINGSRSHGKLLLLLPKDSTHFQPGDLLYFVGNLQPLPKTLNPQRFDYKKYMASLQILFQITPHPSELIKLPQKQRNLKVTAENFRTHIVSKLEARPINQREFAVIQALLLGQRDDLSPVTQQHYAAAGVIHILAVSGLHVGILLVLLDWLLSPLSRMKGGLFIKTLLLLLLLWGYALLAGLSPSIVRAVTMFSFLAVGMQLKRRTNALNTLFLSLLLLLLFDPHLLFQVGFQLSYVAVIAIVLLQPSIYALLHPPGKLLAFLWKITSVTVAAQLGVLPISLYYFHQFPGLFFLSNLVILPFLGLLLSLGFLVILLNLLGILPDFFARFYGSTIELLNNFVEWVAQQESFILGEIPYSELQIFAFYAFLTSVYLFLQRKSLNRLKLLLCGLILIQAAGIYETIVRNPDELIVFHKSRSTLIGEQQYKNLRLSHNLAEVPENLSLVRNYKLERRLQNIYPGRLRNIYNSSAGNLLVVDSTSIYTIPDFLPQKVLLINSPEINLERLLLKLRPEEIIVDGSNYRFLVLQWKKTCKKYKVPFHYTGELGAWSWKK